MSLKFRRFLYIFFILAFLTISPLLCLYAAGYKLDSSSGFSIKKTGILIINSEPSSANIYLNSKPQQLLLNRLFKQENATIKTPAKIKNLLPGEYTVKVEKENYWPWEKKLAIRSGESTFAEDIVLFKKGLPVLISGGRYENLSFSPSGKLAAAYTQENIVLINPADSRISEYSLSGASTGNISEQADISWSPKESRVLIDNFIFEAGNWQQPIRLDELIRSNTSLDNSLASASSSRVKWGESENIIYFNDDKTLYQINLETFRLQSLINKTGINNFIIKNKTAYLLEKSPSKTAVSAWNTDTAEMFNNIAIPYSDYRFINSDSRWLNLYDEKFKILYLIDPLSSFKPLKETIVNAASAYWAKNDRLLYTDGFEIWLYNFKTNNRTLLTRVSREVKNIFLHESDNYVIFITDAAINVIELDDREKRNIIEIMEFKHIKNPFVSRSGELIYFYAEIGNQSGIYKLAL